MTRWLRTPLFIKCGRDVALREVDRGTIIMIIINVLWWSLLLQVACTHFISVYLSLTSLAIMITIMIVDNALQYVCSLRKRQRINPARTAEKDVHPSGVSLGNVTLIGKHRKSVSRRIHLRVVNFLSYECEELYPRFNTWPRYIRRPFFRWIAFFHEPAKQIIRPIYFVYYDVNDRTR